MENLNEQEVRAFVRKEADYYLKKWQTILEGRGQRVGFNWAAFFLTGLWLAYRKMFKMALIFYGIILILPILKSFYKFYTFAFLGKPETPVALDILESLVDLVAAIFCGTFGNIWYLSHTRKAINKVRRQELKEEAYFQSLSKSGGTSWGKSLAIFILFILVLTVLGLLPSFLTALLMLQL